MGIETTVKLDGTNIHRPYDNGLTLMFRPDALVREKASGDLYVISWKTCSTFGKRNELQARHDMQSMSEIWGLLNDGEPRDWQGQQTTNALSDVRVSGDGVQDSVLDVAARNEAERLRLSSSEGIQQHIGTSGDLSGVQRSASEGADIGSSVPQSGVCEAGSHGSSDTGGELSTRASHEVLIGSDLGHSGFTTEGSSVQSADGEVWNQQAADIP